MVFLLAIHMDAEGQIFTGLEEVDLFSLKQQGIGAQINVFFPAVTSPSTISSMICVMQQRLAAGNADHRGTAFFHGRKALFGRQLFLSKLMGRILDFPARLAHARSAP